MTDKDIIVIRITIYSCKDGEIIHDADKHQISIYYKTNVEYVQSNKTIKEVLDIL